MSKNKIHITIDNLEEWMCSTGFLFPRNSLELKRFDKLYPKVERNISDDVVDPDAIFEGIRKGRTFKIKPESQDEKKFSQLRMVARNKKNLPDHILKKIKKNQDSNGKKPDQ